MAFFDDLGKKISEVGQGAVQKTKDMADTAKINSMMAEEERKINNIYYQIGMMYVAQHPTDYEEIFAVLIASLNESLTKIAEYKDKIREIKKIAICPKCGSEVDSGAMFCAVCGQAMPNVPTEDVSSMQKCSACGKFVPKNMKFCTTCGSPMTMPVVDNMNTSAPASTVRTCLNCGAVLVEGSVFCANCGART